MPQAFLFAVVAIYLNYWITKYMVVNWYKKPDNYGLALVTLFIDAIPIFTFVWALGMLYFFGISKSAYDGLNTERET